MITNIRHGFATNSSSSHSVVIFKNTNKVRDDFGYGDEFGWNAFTLISPKRKIEYFVSQIFPDLSEMLIDYQGVGSYEELLAKLDAKSRDEYGYCPKDFIRLFGDLSTHPAWIRMIEDVKDGSYSFAGIDHQSRWDIVFCGDYKTVAEYEEYFKKCVSDRSISYPPNMSFVPDSNGIHQWRDEYTKNLYAKLLKEILKDNTVVLGGNDNSGEHEYSPPFQPYKPSEEEAIAYQKELEKSPTVYDDSFVSVLDEIKTLQGMKVVKNNDGYVFFNPHTGLKISVDTDPNVKSQYPQLVDMKLTDFCPFGCAFCYQGSTLKGTHADTEFILEMISDLADNNVLEIAFGGGEPTLHPDFEKIIEFTRDKGIVPNFTTRNLKWIMDPKNIHTLNLCGGVAYSLDMNDKDVSKFLLELEEFCGPVEDFDELLSKTKDTYKLWSSPNHPWMVDKNKWDEQANRFLKNRSILSKMVIHVVMGVEELDATFSNIERIYKKGFERRGPSGELNEFFYNVNKFTLLGYKTTGFGNNYSQHSYNGWVSKALSLRPSETNWNLGGIQIGIDTALVNQTSQEYLAEFDPRTYYSKEGQHSFYIDAVKQTAHTSSYCNDIGVKIDLTNMTTMDMWTQIEMK